MWTQVLGNLRLCKLSVLVSATIIDAVTRWLKCIGLLHVATPLVVAAGVDSGRAHLPSLPPEAM